MIAEFLGVNSKNTFNGKPFVGTWVFFFRNSYGRREKERDIRLLILRFYDLLSDVKETRNFLRDFSKYPQVFTDRFFIADKQSDKRRTWVN